MSITNEDIMRKNKTSCTHLPRLSTPAINILAKPRKEVGSIRRVALSFNLSALSTSSRALSHICLARENSVCASSISLLVSSLTRSAYAFSTAANRICSDACHFSVSAYSSGLSGPKTGRNTMQSLL